jgi:hypothetical protein
MSTHVVPDSTKWSDENIIDLLRKLRNDLIKDFLDERFLKEYIYTHYKIKELSAVKLEFIKGSLKELLIAPVDVKHYAKIITHIKETDTASLSEGNETLFYKEIDQLLKRFIF